MHLSAHLRRHQHSEALYNILDKKKWNNAVHIKCNLSEKTGQYRHIYRRYMYCEEGKGILYVQLCLYISCRDEQGIDDQFCCLQSLLCCLQTQCVRYCAEVCVSVVMNSSAKSLFVLVLQSSFPPFSWCSYYHVLFGRRMQKPAALVQFYNILPDVKRLLEGWCGSFIMAGAVEKTIDERQEDFILAVRAKPEIITLE